MINLYSSADIATMASGGKILAQILEQALTKVKPGVTTLGLDKFVDNAILAAGAKSSFKMEKGYSFATCMCVNDMVVHGVPTSYQLQAGDILGIDLGVYYQGFHSDGSWTVQVGGGENSFLKTGQWALEEAIKKCIPGNHIGDISKTIQDIIEAADYSCVKQLVGHGVGRRLHEDPEVPCYLRGSIGNTPEIKEGMVIAVEVIYNQGKSPVVYGSNDGWTIVTRDGLPSGLFEHTVAITQNGPKILTLASKL